MAAPALAAMQAAVGTIGSVVDALKAVPEAVRGFVAALNPVAVENLDRAYRSLYATIGYALEPVIHAATRTIDRFAGAIMGGMDRLRPVIEKVADLFESAFTPALSSVMTVLDSVATIAEALGPVFRLLGRQLEGAAATADVLVKAFTAVTEALTLALLGGLGDLGKASQVLQDGFVALSVALLQATAHVLLLVGATDVLRKLLRSFQVTPPASGRPGAPQGFQVGGLESVYQRRLLASAQGMGGPGVPEQQLTTLQRIAAEAERMAKMLEAGKGLLQKFLEKSSGVQAANIGATIPAALLRLFFGNRNRADLNPAGD